MKLIKFYLKYILYFLITQKQRHNYLISKIEGYNCIDSYDDSKFIPGSARMYVFDENEPTKRDYLTYKEFKQIHFPYKK